MSKSLLFFRSSYGVTERLGELFNFVWANAVAMWTLREQVQQFVLDVPDATEQQLAERFVQPSGVTSADLRTTCLRWTWEQQQEQFAKVLLFDLCALFESWLENVVPLAFPRNKVKFAEKQLQFPTSVAPNGDRLGLMAVIDLANQRQSMLMKNDLFPQLCLHKKNSWASLESMLRAYRYFKECRNGLIHTGGACSQKLFDLRHQLSGIALTDLGLVGPLKLPALTVGKPIHIALPDIVAFSNIVHRMIITLDAAIAVTVECEAHVMDRISKIVPKGFRLPTADPDRRLRAIRWLIRKAKLPEPVSTAQLEALIVNRFQV